jgi:hypothetical protein
MILPLPKAMLRGGRSLLLRGSVSLFNEMRSKNFLALK